MELVNKTYVERLYWGIITAETECEEIESRDPLAVKDDERMQGFRFFDQSIIENDGKTFDGPKENYSGWIYIGRRLNLEQVEAEYGNDPRYKNVISNMKNNKFETVCFTRGSVYPMHDGDMTLDEYKNQKTK